jgi:hypothetical protein
MMRKKVRKFDLSIFVIGSRSLVFSFGNLPENSKNIYFDFVCPFDPRNETFPSY